MSAPGRRDPAIPFTRITAALVLGVAAASFFVALRHEWGTPFEQSWLGHNGARYAIAARNLLRLPLSATHGWPCFECGDVVAEELTPYVRHPPLFTWLVAGAFAAGGESEDVVRSVPLVATLLLAATLGLLAARRGDLVPGAVAAATFLLLPMTQIYGTHADMQSTPTALCIAVATLGAAWFVERRSRAARALLLIALVLAMALDWPGWVAAGALVVALAWQRERRTAVLVAIVAAVTGTLLIGYALATAGSSDLRDAIWQRSTSFWSAPPEERPLGAFLVNFDRLLPAWLWAAASVVAVIACAVARRAVDPPPARSFPAGWVLFVVGAIHVLAFPSGAMLHEYWSHLLAAPLALLVAAAVAQTLRAWPRARRFVLAALLLAVVPAGVIAAQRAGARLDANRGIRHRIFGLALRAATPFDAHVVTNSDYNAPGMWMVHPELSWYSDRDVRGGVTTLAALAPEASHFLYLPMKGFELDRELAEWLAAHAQPQPFALHNAKLWRLDR